MKIDDIGAIEYDRNKNKVFGIKSAILWGHKGSTATPLMYFRKPKNMAQKDFDDILDRMYIRIFEREVR